jgi:pleiotropic regulator 1
MLTIGDNGSMSFWDWKTGHRFQNLDTTAQPGSLDAESGIMYSTFDRTGTRLITAEADKTSKLLVSEALPGDLHHRQRCDYVTNCGVVKIWRENEKATPETHPLEWKPSFGSRKF